MTILKHRPRRDEASIPVATHRTPTWPQRSDTADEITFDDIKALPEPDWAARQLAGPVDGIHPSMLCRVPLDGVADLPLPSRELIEYQTAVSVAIMADQERHLDTLRVIDEIAAAAPDPHTLAMALAPVAELLAGVA